jgi:glutamate:GABA antiporter
MEANKQSNKGLGWFSLAMIAVVSVDSLRNLPISAQYGYSLVTFYLIAGLLFFMPLAWVTGKLVVQYPKTGGAYVWVTAAFGDSYGSMAIWLQWLYNVIWYPTLFAFISATLGILIAPGLEKNKWFILCVSLGFFWLISFLHCRGMRSSSWISMGSAIAGTIFPMFLMIGMAIYWLISGKPSATPFSFWALLPSVSSIENIGFFSNILFSILGIEIIAMHAGNVFEPQKAYPKALGISSVLILITVICSSLALCIIMPAEKIALVSGLMDVLQLFFSAYHITNVATLIGICIIIGGLGIAASWMIGLARGLHASLCAMNAPAWMQKLNKNQMPSGALFMQAVVYSISMCFFLFFPDINSSYWILSAITAQFALLYYILVFGAAIKLLRQVELSPVNNFLSFFLPGVAIVICVIGIAVGFIPPSFVLASSKLKYELCLISGFGIMIALLVYRFMIRVHLQ